MPTSHFEQLLAEAQQGSSHALGLLLQGCRDRLLAQAQFQLPSELRSKAGGSDLIQDSFLYASKNFPKFRGTTEVELLAWLRQILRTCSRSLIRSHRDRQKRSIGKEVRLDKLVTLQSHLPACARTSPPDEGLISGERAEVIQQLLGSLPEKQRQVLRLRYFEQMELSRIGERLGISEEAARKACIRGTKAIAQLLKGQGAW